jgi:hypothetical protein
LYPIEGKGLYPLNRGEYKALGVLNTFGDTPQAAQILKNMKIEGQTLNEALKVWRIIQK